MRNEKRRGYYYQKENTDGFATEVAEEVAEETDEAPVEEAVEETVEAPVVEPTSFRVEVTVNNLNIRKGPGKNFERTGEFTGIGIFTLSKKVDGEGSKKGWGKLENGKGWISLDFCKEID